MDWKKFSIIVSIVSGLIGIYQFIWKDNNTNNIQTNITTYSSSNSIGQNAVSNNNINNTIFINSK